MPSSWKHLYQTKILHAIVYGQLTVNLPVLLLCFGGMPLILKASWPWWLRLILAVFHFVIGFLISKKLWSRMITRWRLKAFTWVDQEHWVLLKDWAIRGYLIYWDDSFEELEKRSFGEKEVLDEIAQLLHHFESVELIGLDLKSPWRLEYQIKKVDAWVEICLRFLFIGLGIYYLLYSHLELGVIIIALVLFIGSKPRSFTYAFKGETVFAISESGFDLLLPRRIYIAWDDLINIDFLRDNRELEIRYYREGKASKLTIKMGTYNIPDFQNLYRLISVYQRRYAEFYQQRAHAQAPNN